MEELERILAAEVTGVLLLLYWEEKSIEGRFP
jgi:hypothetical protein